LDILAGSSKAQDKLCKAVAAFSRMAKIDSSVFNTTLQDRADKLEQLKTSVDAFSMLCQQLPTNDGGVSEEVNKDSRALYGEEIRTRIDAFVTNLSAVHSSLAIHTDS
jgi:hypothetical protein